MNTTRTPPTGYRDEDGKLHDLDWNDKATFDWIQAKQADHAEAEANRAKRISQRHRRVKRQQTRTSRRANR